MAASPRRSVHSQANTCDDLVFGLCLGVAQARHLWYTFLSFLAVGATLPTTALTPGSARAWHSFANFSFSYPKRASQQSAWANQTAKAVYACFLHLCFRRTSFMLQLLDLNCRVRRADANSGVSSTSFTICQGQFRSFKASPVSCK